MATLREYQDLRGYDYTRPKLLIVDGDWVAFQALASSETEIDWGDDIWTLYCDHDKAFKTFKERLETVRSTTRAFKGHPMVIAFSGSRNWRKELVDPTYKSNRKRVRKPCGYSDFVERITKNYPCVVEDTLEGDDIIGIIASKPRRFGYNKAVIYSCDKDFLSVPSCEFYHTTTDKLHRQTRALADQHHMLQTIKGDPVDGYKGIPGMGEVTAQAFLKEPYMLQEEPDDKGNWKYLKVPQGDASLWDCIVSLGAKAGVDADYVLRQARMAYILRYEDYNFITKEVKLWEPPLSH